MKKQKADVKEALRAHFEYSIEQYKRSGVVKYVKILAIHDSCEACKKLTQKRYKLDKVPELPYKYCTREGGCRCCVAPIVDEEILSS